MEANVDNILENLPTGSSSESPPNEKGDMDRDPHLRTSSCPYKLDIIPNIGGINEVDAFSNSEKMVRLKSESPTLPGFLIKSFRPQVCMSISSNSAEQFKDIQSLLMKYRREGLLLSEIHSLASAYCRTRNQICTLTALTITLICSVTEPLLKDCAVSGTFSTVSFAFIGGLNVVFNFLSFQQRTEKHKQSRDSYLAIVDTIEVSLAYSHEEGANAKYDFNKVLNEVRQIKNTITKNAPAIPHTIAKKYETILSPSLLKHELKLKIKEETCKK